MTKCRECKTGNLTAIDVDDCSITVECDNCGDVYLVEPDGLDEGGLEWVDAMIKFGNK